MSTVRTGIQNLTANPLMLSAPYHGVIQGGQSAVVGDDPATVIANLAGVDFMNGVISVNVLDPATPLTPHAIAIGAGQAIKAQVLAASTANIDLTSGPATVDGVTMVAGARVLAKDQSTAADKGIYVWNGLAVAMTRSPDASSASQLVQGFLVEVQQGTANNNTLWELSSSVVTLGTDAVTFGQFVSGITYGAAGDMAAAGNAAANAAGVSTKVSRTDHVHAQGPIIAAAAALKTADPGTGAAIPVTASTSVPLVIGSAGAETNTLAIPTFIGQTMDIFVDTVGSGTRAITSSQAINVAGNTVMTFNAAWDRIKLTAASIGGALRWMVDVNASVTLS